MIVLEIQDKSFHGHFTFKALIKCKVRVSACVVWRETHTRETAFASMVLPYFQALLKLKKKKD